MTAKTKTQYSKPSTRNDRQCTYATNENYLKLLNVPCMHNTMKHGVTCYNVIIYMWTAFKQKKIQKNDKELHYLETNSALQNHIMSIVTDWTSSRPLNELQLFFLFTSLQLRKAHDDQVKIGMHHFFRGIISKEWGEIQEEYYVRKHLPAKYNRNWWEKTPNYSHTRIIHICVE